MPVIPARSHAWQRLLAGQSIKIINTSGGQVIDAWAFSTKPAPFPNFMSMSHTRSSFDHKLFPGLNESLLDNRRAPIMTVVEDTSPGVHDVLYAPYSPERYEQLGASRDHPSCANNLCSAVKLYSRDEPNFQKVAEFLENGWMPDPMNLFMHVVIEDGKAVAKEPVSRQGDYIVLKAEQDCVVVMSACPMDLSGCNRDGPQSAEYEVI